MEKKRVYMCVKRVQDILLSVLALVFLSPLLLLIALRWFWMIQGSALFSPRSAAASEESCSASINSVLCVWTRRNTWRSCCRIMR